MQIVCKSNFKIIKALRAVKKDYSISIYLDTRRAKSNGLFPVKLRVFTGSPRIQKLYPTIFEFTEKEFNNIWNTTKPRGEYKDLRKKIQAIEVKANRVADKITHFTFEQFERQLYRKAGDGVSVKYLYEQSIQEFNRHNQIGTASTYDLSQKSIIEFNENTSNQKYTKLTLFDINHKWLEDYEYYMTEIKGRSLTTVSMYIRTLRAIYNKAIDEKEIEKDYYPFGKRKYQVPASKNTKKALSDQQLKTLYNAQPETLEQKKAKDFWFFSYSCSGMNIKDISLLRYQDINEGKIEFYRAKTRITSKGNLRPITVYLNEFSNRIIEEYGNKNNVPTSLVFDIITDGLTPKQQQLKIKNFTRFINQHLKKLCKAHGLPALISTNWARHSFATSSIRKGASMEFMQESLGHGNIATTQNYFAGFDTDTKKEFAQTLMNFD